MTESMNVTAGPQVTQQVDKSRVEPSEIKQPQQPQQESPLEASKAVAEKAAVSAAQLESSIAQLNDFMRQGQRSLSFSVDESAGDVVIRVMDTETQELIRQIPNEEALKFKQHVEGMLGLLLNDQA